MELPDLAEKRSAAEIKAIDGLNSWTEKGYNGPCLPGGTHHYIFKLYALDKTLAKDGMAKAELLDAMKNHIPGDTTLTELLIEIRLVLLTYKVCISCVCIG